MSRTFSGSDTSLTVAGRLVGNGELSEISADHIELDFNVIKALAIVDCDVVTNHLGKDDGVSEMGLNWSRAFSRLSVLLGFLALSIEADVFVFNL